jgi:AcrR family transcriptional regulator
MERQLTRHGADRKADLIAQAEALFLERGYDETRMVDIAERAGVAKGLVYWYFDNKESLFREIIADTRERLRAAMVAATEPVTDDQLATLYIGTVEAVRFSAEHHRMFSLMYALPGFRDAHAESAQVHAHDVALVIEEGQRLGVIRPGHPELMGHLNGGVVNQAVGAFVHGTPIEPAAHGAAEYVVRALAASTRLADATIAAYGPKTAKSRRANALRPERPPQQRTRSRSRPA